MDSALNKLFAAVENYDIKTARLLIREGECLKDPEFRTCAFFYDFTDLDMIRLLAEAGADINAINDVGEWALRNAAWEGEAEAVAYLLSEGAKPNLTSTGETAIHMGVCSDKIEVVRLLLEAGANINATDVDGWTCLWWLKSTPMATFLLNHGADPAFSDWDIEGFPQHLPENHESIPEAVGDLLRAHRLKSSGLKDSVPTPPEV